MADGILIHMNKSQLKQLIREVIEEIAINEPAVNPSYEDVKVGDVYVSHKVFTSTYVSTVLKVGPIEKRFGKDDRIVTVKIEAWADPRLIAHTEGQLVDHSKRIWVSQLLKGSV